MHGGIVQSGFLMVLVAVCANSQRLDCDRARGYELLSGNKCVKVYGSIDMSWHEAQDVCRRYGSRLVTIKDQYDNDKLGELVRMRTGSYDTRYWIGLSQTYEDTCSCNELKWENGQLATENQGFWMDNQPDDRKGDCVYAGNNTRGRFNYIYDRPYAWSFKSCYTKSAFVCEREAAPAGSFHCFSGGYIRSEDTCDDTTHCMGDDSDELNCPQYCKYQLEGEGGFLNPLTNYRNGQTCTWAIITPLGTNAYVELRNLQTETDADFVTIFSGSIIETKATRVARISGSNQSPQRFQSYNNMLLIKFSSDSSVTGSGFTGVYGSARAPPSSLQSLIAYPTSRSYTVQQQLGNLTSFVGMNDYVFVLETVDDENGNIITLQINEWIINDDDFIEIYDGDTPESPVLAKLCNSGCKNYDVVFSTSTTMSIFFRRMKSMSKDVRFTFSYAQGCYYSTTDNWGMFFSPGYPKGINYPNCVECTWKIEPREPITVYFDSDLFLVDQDFDVADNGDFVEMYNNNTRLSQRNRGFNATELAGNTFMIDSGILEVKFFSSSIRNGRGFKATWSTGCENPNYDEFTIRTPSVSNYYSYKATSTLTCAEGYAFQQEQISTSTSSVTIECGYKGEWMTYLQIPRCTPVYCGDVPSIQNGYIESSTGSVYSSIVTYRCYPGLSLQGPESITCNSNGQWDNQPSCRAELCQPFSLSLTNGIGKMVNGDDSAIGSIVEYTCNPGYEIEGEPIKICQTNGTYSTLTASCKKLTCRLPPMLKGFYQFIKAGEFIDYEAVVNVFCNNGYTYQNTTITTVSCLADRTVTQLPVCVDVDECETQCRNNANCLNTEGSFSCSCQEGFTGNGLSCSDLNECQQNNPCDQGCDNEFGTYTCSCEQPYVLFTNNMVSGYEVPLSETGYLPTDTYRFNHTCVLIECPAPLATITNGMLLDKRDHHRYGDYVEYQCNVGYAPRSTFLMCQRDGTWSRSPPDCVATTCPTDIINSVQNRADFNPGPYSYGQQVYLNCTRAGQTFNYFRHCTYDPSSDTYQLQGSPYECGVINCGSIDSQFSSIVTDTIYPAQFPASCPAGTQLEGTGPDGTSSTVTCSPDGLWEYGSLQCSGQSCTDPGYPAGGDIVATSFASGSEASFVCNRRGYSLLSTFSTLTCQGSTWSSTASVVNACVDTEPPVFSGNCNSTLPPLTRYELLSGRLPSITVGDNTGIEELTISPANANSSLYVVQPLTVTYTAYDYRRNAATCTINVVIADEEPPTLSCPSIRNLFLDDETDNVQFSLQQTQFTSNDNVAVQSFNIIVDLPRSNFTVADLYQTFPYTAEVRDEANNVDTCRGQVFVSPRQAACVELGFPTPLNANKICTSTLNGLQCLITCQPLYTFQSIGRSRTVSCTNGAWSSDPIPACVLDRTAPVITCPASIVLEQTEESDTNSVDFTSLTQNSAYSEFDLNNIQDRVFNPPNKTFTVNDLYQTTVVTLEVKDVAGNLATCKFQYTVLPRACSPLSLPTPVNAKPNVCTRRSTFGNQGYDCTIVCNDGFVLRGLGYQRTVSCSDGLVWPEVYPSCVLDTTQPAVQCPESRIITLQNAAQTYNVTFGDANSPIQLVGSASDVGGIESIVYNPASRVFDSSYLYQAASIVQMTATDRRGNSNNCLFSVIVEAAVCSDLSLPTPVNGAKICTPTINNGWSCSFTCEAGYTFPTTTNSAITSTCNPGSPFNTYVPACVTGTISTPKQFIGTLRYQYAPVSSGVLTVDNICIDHYISQRKDQISAGVDPIVVQMAGKLRQLCSSVASLSVQVQFLSYEGRVGIDANGNQRTVTIDYTYTLTGSNTTAYSKCAEVYANLLDDGFGYQLSQNIAGGLNNVCPEVAWSSSIVAQQIRSDLYCLSPYYESLQNNLCVLCPAGTDSDGVVCTPCPLGSYRPGTSLGQCVACPNSGTTRYPGATSSNQCTSPCSSSGRVSTSGFEPCYNCDLGFYATNNTYCQRCPGGTTTQIYGASSENSCQPATATATESCGLGTESDGNGGCTLCDFGTYKAVSSISCTSCQGLSTTYIRGAVSSTSCTALCGLGLVSNDGRAPCTSCPKGRYSVNSTYCEACPAGSTTEGVGATSSTACLPEATFRVNCPRGTYRDAGTGDCINCAIGTYQDSEEQPSCKPCVASKSTYVVGAVSFSQCFDTCAPGFTSSSGLSPCEPCGVGRYWVNSQECQLCPNGGTTASNAAVSLSECRARCPAGQFSSTGFNLVNAGCRPCPRNHYQPNIGATSCELCPANTYTTANQRTLFAECVSSNTLCDCENGGTCNTILNTIFCECPRGFFGSKCQEVVDYCNSSPCYNGGVCSSSTPGHSCDCRGLATGANCENIIQTCDGSFCSVNSYCINRPGSVQCLCKDGFSGTRCETNTTICVTNPCNSVGTQFNGCTDVSFGENIRRKCTCLPGYEGEDCSIDTDDCASNPCINKGECRDLVNGFQCQCVNGYTGTYCQVRPNRCQNINCGPNGMCVDNHKEESYHCICVPGYAYGSYTHYSVTLNSAPQAVSSQNQNICLQDQVNNVDECRERCTNSVFLNCDLFSYQPSSRACCLFTSEQAVNFTTFSVNPYNTYMKMVMTPDDDFYTIKYDMNTPGNLNSNNKDNELRSTFNDDYGLNICGGTEPLAAECCIVDGGCDNLPFGTSCTTDGLTCNDAACQSIDFEIRFKCAAQRVFLNNMCSQKADFCASNPCERGFCSNEFNGYRCSCPAGYTGLNCQTNIDECAFNPCRNDATCTDLVNRYDCNCTEGFEGVNCQSRVNYCITQSVNCNNRGNCVNLATDYECNCNPGYEGKDCEDEIDRCRSNPCLQGSICSKRFNDYSCECVSGWTGKNCDEVVNNCLTFQGQQCRASCKNIFNSYYCECPLNTYGMNCEFQPDPCRDYSKCQNNAVCSVSGENMSCQCPTKYSGDGCHVLVNHCGITNQCQNGGICMATSQGYRCSCPTGYDGTNCEIDINECTGRTTPCPGGGTCYDTIGKFYCRYPLTKIGESGKDYDPNYDLYFSHSMAYAWIPYFIEVNGVSALSFSLWVRYSDVDGEGVYMTQYFGDRLQTSVKFMEVHEDGISVFGPDQNNRLNRVLSYQRGIIINDGNWHLISGVYNTTAGIMELYCDTIFHGEITDNALMIGVTNLRMWVVLGCKFDKTQQMCKGSDSFHGYLSQINWYSRPLTFDEIADNFISPRMVFMSNTLSGVVLVWNEYILESGVDRMIPSQASSLSCDSPQRTIKCSFFTAANLPKVTGCPSDFAQFSSDRLTQVSWTEPTFTGLGANGQLIQPAYLSGNTYTWNIYDITYVARSDTNYQAYCSFRIYVQESQCELTDNSPFGGRKPQCKSNDPPGRTGCRISCYDNFLIDRMTPDLFTCDATGTWNYAKRFQPFRFPSCGEIKSRSPKVRVIINLTYNMGTPACNAVKSNMEVLLRDQMKNLHQVYKEEMLCAQDDCSDVRITIQCDIQATGRRKRQTSSLNLVTIEVMNADPMTEFNSENYSVTEFLTYQAIGENAFDFPRAINNGVILKNLFNVDVSPVCGPNQLVIDNQCVECGAGNYFRYTDATNTTAICDDCPLGSYQTNPGQSGCTGCPSGQTTEMTGNYEASACKESCKIGNYYDKIAMGCRPCAIGYYQDEVGQFRCKGCDAGFTTEFEGTNSSSLCTSTCDHGQQLDGKGSCELCPVGQYRNASESRMCEACQPGLITPGLGARSSSECNITACGTGTKLNQTTNTCEQCPLGTYQDEKWQTMCKSCGDPNRYLTLSLGSDEQTDCTFYCPEGFQVSTEPNCEPCTVGFYKNIRLGTCQACDGNYRTPGEGSTSPNDCSIYKCPVGFAPNATNNGCSPCPLGKYQDVEYSTMCKDCSIGESTREMGSNSSSACEAYCPSGQEKIISSCVVCGQGLYKSNLDGLFSMCQPCNENYTTASSGSTAATDCSIRACGPGTRRAADERSCIDCPLATYQPQFYQQSCIGCTNGLSTREVKSSQASQCETYCGDGFEKNAQGGCDACPVGYYKDNDDGLFGLCQLCPEVNITSSQGSQQVSDCNIGNCSAGQRRRADNICELCPKGTYQVNKWQNFCTPCGTDKTTQLDGSTSQGDCILVCGPGKEDVGGVCQPCSRGYYKEQDIAAKCDQCGNDRTTETIGANSSSLCNLPSCQAGTYLNLNLSSIACTPCGYDTYQDQKWMTSCMQCPNGGVTLKTGANAVTDCVVDCSSGQEYRAVSGGCEFCPIGFYRDRNNRAHTGCQMCNIQRITPTTGSTSSLNCTVANCTTPGTYRDANSNTCRPCPIGQYSNMKWKTFCESCQQGYSTRSTGSVFVTECRPSCPLGEQVGQGNICERCPIGYYREFTTQEDCVQCPNGFKTPTLGSDSSADCTVSDCSAGNYYDLTNSRCTLCPVGTYQPQAGSFQCIGCENGFGYTPQAGATMQSSCNSPCQTGFQYNNVSMICDLCPRGYYQDEANQFVCKDCPNGLKYTLSLGSTLRSQCLSFCDTAANQCSPNATCANNANGAVCTCFTNHDDIGSAPGSDCVHKCDRAYCNTDGALRCIREPVPRCECTKYFEGDRCATRVRADSLDDNTKDIIIPVAIGVSGLILFLIILAVCCLCYMSQKKAKAKRPSRYSSFNGDRIDKASLHSYDYGQTPYNGGGTPRLMLAPHSEIGPFYQDVVYDNGAYLKGGDLEVDGSIDTAVFQA